MVSTSNPKDEPALAVTGERFTPELDGQISLEHWHRYVLAGDFAQGKRVLDIACGEGYGSNYLAQQGARSVVGVDIDSQSVAHAVRRYGKPGVEYRQGSCTAIPLDDHSVDIVVSFETLEHHDQHDAMLVEVRRVLSPGGLLMISCPDKLYYSDQPGYVNSFHVRELYPQNFEALLKAHFKHVAQFGQNFLGASALLPRDEGRSGHWRNRCIEGGKIRDLNHLDRTTIMVAMASDLALPSMDAGLLVDLDTGLQAFKGEQIAAERAALVYYQEQIKNLTAELDAINKSRIMCLARRGWILTERLAQKYRRATPAVAIKPPTPNPRPEFDVFHPLTPEIRAAEATRVNVLMPGLQMAHLFAGYFGILQLAHRIVKDGHRVRLVLYRVADLPDLKQLESQLALCGLEGLLGAIEIVAVGDRRQSLPLSRADRFVVFDHAGAVLAHQACQDLEEKRFLYLVQEYEPLFFEAGVHQARAMEALQLPQMRVYSSQTLKDYIEQQHPGTPHQSSPVVLNAVGSSPPSAAVMRARRKRRLLFYARQQIFSARNLFPLGLQALKERILSGGLDPAHWEFWGIGNDQALPDLPLGRGARLHFIPRVDLDRYYGLLSQYDLGLSLMLSPHPSLTPLDMAAAGLVVVTNTFATKTAASLSAVSENILGVEPTLAGLKEGLRQAESRCPDVEARLRGANIHWARDWDSAWAPAMPWVREFLGAAVRRA